MEKLTHVAFRLTFMNKKVGISCKVRRKLTTNDGLMVPVYTPKRNVVEQLYFSGPGQGRDIISVEQYGCEPPDSPRYTRKH